MRLRPIRSEDAAALTQLYGRLSPETAYQRFFTVMRRLPPDWARILAHVDHDRNAAVVAAGSDAGLVGVARYGTPPGADEAEIAVVVEDGWQRKGLGTILLSALLEHGRSRGISRFLAHVLADNQRMLHLIGRLGTLTERSLDQGIVTVRFTPRPDAPPAEPASTLGNSG